MLLVPVRRRQSWGVLVKLWQIWAITLLVAGAYLAICSELDHRQQRFERCAAVRCA
jgi:hypothetical protein